MIKTIMSWLSDLWVYYMHRMLKRMLLRYKTKYLKLESVNIKDACRLAVSLHICVYDIASKYTNAWIMYSWNLIAVINFIQFCNPMFYFWDTRTLVCKLVLTMVLISLAHGFISK